jgi:drug/metabolite transporter (DMT)-like permease
MSLTIIEQRRGSAAGGAALAATAGLSWGAMFPIAKHGMRHVDALHMTSIRYVLASLVFLALLAAREGRRAIRFEGRALRLLVLGSIGFAGFNLLSYVGLGMTRPQNASLIVATMPFVTLVVVRLRGGAKMARLKLALMAFGFLGVGAVITRGDVGSLVHGGVGGGEALVLAGVTCWVLYTLGAADFPGWSPLRFTALSASLGSLTIVAITELATLAGWEPPPTGHDLAAAGPALAYIVVFGAVVAVLSWNAAVRTIGAPTAALFGNLIPVTTFAIAIAGGYSPNGYELGGALAAVAALVAVTTLNRAQASVRVVEAAGEGSAPDGSREKRGPSSPPMPTGSSPRRRREWLWLYAK